MSHKRLRLSQDTSKSDVRGAPWHSTAIFDTLDNGGTPHVTAPSQTPIRNNPPTKKRPRSPIVITEPSGYFYFSFVLQKNGYIVGTPRNQTHVDAMVFRKSLADWIQQCHKGDAEAQAKPAKFIKDMKEYLNVTENLVHAMTPTLHTEEVFQPSLLHCLLGVMPLQHDVFRIILPKLTDIVYTAKESEDMAFLNSLLNQIKWLPELVNAESLADDILDILSRANAHVQKEMIRYLPDIIPEKFHWKIGDKLRKLLDQFSPLSSTLMECFSVIDISEKDLDKIRTSAVENMALADPKDLPAFFAFLFRADDPDILRGVIDDLREKFKFEISATDSNTFAVVEDIVDKIRFCVSVNDQIVTLWTKVVKDAVASQPKLFQPIDLVMLLIFLDNYKTAEVPLKILLGSEDVSLGLIDDVIKSCPALVDPLFTPFSKFLERMLWLKETKSYSVATKILVKLFAATNDYNAQHVVVTFTSVLAHGHICCRDIAIEGLTSMSSKNTLKLLKFMPLLMGIMDYVIKFSPSQVRDIMKVLAAAASIPKNRESERFDTEFQILMRKQLTHTNPQIKCVGVIAAVALLDQLVKQHTDESKTQGLVNFIWRQVERHEDACWIYFDEMSTVVGSRNVSAGIMEELKAILSEKFSSNWTMPVNQISSDFVGNESLKLQSVMNANSEISTDALAIKFEDITVRMSPLVIPAHTRILCTLESKISNGSLEEIDIIIGCPLLLPNLSLYTSETMLKCYTAVQKSEMGRYLLLAINFFREVVSGFCTQEDAEIRIKIWMRLKDLVKLQRIFTSFIGSSSSLKLTLPFAYALENTHTTLDKIGGEKKRRNPKGKKKESKKSSKKVVSKTRVADSDDDDDDDDDERPGPSTKSNKTKSKSKSKATTRKIPVTPRTYTDIGEEIHPNNIVPYLRHFDTNVFLMLKSPFVVRPPEINYNGLLVRIGGSQTPQALLKPAEILTPHILVLILRDLHHQIAHSRICIIQNVALGFGKDFFGCLCDLLDTLFQEFVKQEMDGEEEKEADACFRYLYCALSHYIIRTKLPEYKSYFEKALTTMAQKGGTIDSELHEDEKVAQFLSGFPDNFVNPPTAVEQLKFMKTVYNLVEADMKVFISMKIEENVELFLQRDWKLSSATVQLMLKTWLTTNENTLEILSNLANSLIGEETHRDIPITEKYKACSSLNFHTWYRVIIETLAQYVQKHTRMKQDDDVDELHERWNAAFAILKILVSVIQKNRKPLIITQLLRNTRIFLEAFTNNGVKLLPKLWSRNTNQAKIFVRSLQAPARKIQYVCEHCKVQKSTQLMRHVPLVKKSLETLVFRMREVVASYDASAFWMGSLVHKNLDGEVITSQPFVESGDESDSDGSDAAENNEDLFDDSEQEDNQEDVLDLPEIEEDD